MHKQHSRAFTVLEVLLSVVVMGVLGSFVIAKFAAVKERAYITAMKNDLRAYASAQEIYYDRYGSYATAPTQIGDFALSDGVVVSESSGDPLGWGLELRHIGTDVFCWLAASVRLDTDTTNKIACSNMGTVFIDASSTNPKSGEPVTFNATQAIQEMAVLNAGMNPAFAANLAEIEQLQWDFGDGTVLSGPPETHTIVTHSYAHPGQTYVVTLHIRKRNGAKAVGVRGIRVSLHGGIRGGADEPPQGGQDGEVPGDRDSDGDEPEDGGTPGEGDSEPLPNRPPIASFSYAPTPAYSHQTITFDASTTTDPDGDPLTFEWDFGDFRSGSGVMASHSYTAPGNYSVRLTVKDARGLSDSIQQTIVIHNLAPIASFTYSPTSPKVGEIIHFDASASSDPDGIGVTYSWDFGDGTSSTIRTPGKGYAVAGTYTVRLVVTDSHGATDQIEQEIVVTSDQPDLLYGPSPGFVSHNWKVINQNYREETRLRFPTSTHYASIKLATPAHSENSSNRAIKQIALTDDYQDYTLTHTSPNGRVWTFRIRARTTPAAVGKKINMCMGFSNTTGPQIELQLGNDNVGACTGGKRGDLLEWIEFEKVEFSYQD